MQPGDHPGASALLSSNGAAPRLRTAGIAGLGMAVPPKVVTNGPISERLGVADNWIETRTGIQERRYAAPEATLAGLAAEAGREALESAGVEAGCAVRRRVGQHPYGGSRVKEQVARPRVRRRDALLRRSVDRL